MKRAARTRHRWNEENLFAALTAEAGPGRAGLARRLYDWSTPRVHHFYWGKGQSPSVTAAFEVAEGPIQPWSLYAGGSGLGLAINFEWCRRRPTDALHQFLEAILPITKIASLRDEILARDFAKRPTVPLTELDADRISLTIQALDRFLEA